MGGRLVSRKGGDAMEVFQALSLIIAFGALIITLIGVTVTIVIALNQKK